MSMCVCVLVVMSGVAKHTSGGTKLLKFPFPITTVDVEFPKRNNRLGTTSVTFVP